MRNKWISGPWVIILPVINSLFSNHSNATASNPNIKKGQRILNAEKHLPRFIKGLFTMAALPENRSSTLQGGSTSCVEKGKGEAAHSSRNSPWNLLCRVPERGKHELNTHPRGGYECLFLAGKPQSKHDLNHLFAAPQPLFLAQG